MTVCSSTTDVERRPFADGDRLMRAVGLDQVIDTLQPYEVRFMSILKFILLRRQNIDTTSGSCLSSERRLLAPSTFPATPFRAAS